MLVAYSDSEGEDEPRRLVNGSRGTVTKFVDVRNTVPELEKQVKKVEEDLEKTRATLSDEELKRQTDRLTKLKMQLAWIDAQPTRQLRHGQQARSATVPFVLFKEFKEAVPVFPEEFKFETVGLGFNIRRQIPLLHAWAITIHKAQGMTLPSVHRALPEICFTWPKSIKPMRPSSSTNKFPGWGSAWKKPV